MSDELQGMRAQLLSELKRAPPAQRWSMDAARLVAINVGVSAAVMALAAVTRQQHSSDAFRWVGAVLLFSVVVGGAIIAVLPGRRWLQLVVLGLSVASVPALVLASSGSGAELPFFADADCALAELGVALVPSLATVLVLRRFAYQPVRALVGGLGAAATGVLVLHFTCVVGALSHVLVFHVTPAVLVACALVAVRSKVASQAFTP